MYVLGLGGKSVHKRGKSSGSLLPCPSAREEDITVKKPEPDRRDEDQVETDGERRELCVRPGELFSVETQVEVKQADGRKVQQE